MKVFVIHEVVEANPLLRSSTDTSSVAENYDFLSKTHSSQMHFIKSKDWRDTSY